MEMGRKHTHEELHEVDDARTEYTEWSEKPNGERGENAQ